MIDTATSRSTEEDFSFVPGLVVSVEGIIVTGCPGAGIVDECDCPRGVGTDFVNVVIGCRETADTRRPLKLKVWELEP